MPVTIQLRTVPGTKEIDGRFTSYTMELFGLSLGSCEFIVLRTDQIAQVVREFGERIRAAHPDASFYVNVQVRKGDRKPRGYDAAEKAGAFGKHAFMHVVDKRGAAAAASAAVP